MSKKSEKEVEPKAPEEVTKEPASKAPADPLIKKISELKKLSEAEQQAFRNAGGTAVEG